MANYHVGCGIAGIYAGTLNKKGEMLVNKLRAEIDSYKEESETAE